MSNYFLSDGTEIGLEQWFTKGMTKFDRNSVKVHVSVIQLHETNVKL